MTAGPEAPQLRSGRPARGPAGVGRVRRGGTDRRLHPAVRLGRGQAAERLARRTNRRRGHGGSDRHAAPRPRPATDPWRVGYAPRGPVGAFDRESGRCPDRRSPRVARQQRIVHVLIDPEVETSHPLVGELSGSRLDGERRGPDAADPRHRPGPSRGGARSDLRSKWRQYVNKARRAGVTVEDVGAGGLDDFYRIYAKPPERAGFIHRARSAYDDVFRAFDRGGARACSWLAWRTARRRRSCCCTAAQRVIEPYGGMTEAGADSAPTTCSSGRQSGAPASAASPSTTCGACRTRGSSSSRRASVVAR